VVWRGISTRHVREGFGDAVSIEEVREAWMPISPLAYTDRLARMRARPMRFIAARHDLTFPQTSATVIDEVRRTALPSARRGCPAALHQRRAPVGLPRRLEDSHVHQATL
jgi:hypothetical protein